MNEKVEVPHVFRKMVFRWSLVSIILIGLFWVIYYFTTGNVLVNIQPQDLWGLEAIEMPRWMDILMGPFWSIALAALVSAYTKPNAKPEDKKDIAYNMVAGIAAGTCTALFFGIEDSLIISVIVLVVVSLARNLDGMPMVIVPYCFGVSASFLYGLTFGLVTGIVIIFMYLIVFLVAALLLISIILLAQGGLKNILAKFVSWLKVVED